MVEAGLARGQGAIIVSDFQQGLMVTVQGMALVFASLGLLMLIIAGLERLFRERPAMQTAGPRVPRLAGGAVTEEELGPEIAAPAGSGNDGRDISARQRRLARPWPALLRS